MCTKRDLVHRCASNFCCDASFAALLHTRAEEYDGVPEPSLTPARRVSRELDKALIGAKSADTSELQLAREIPRKASLHVSRAFWSCHSARIERFLRSRHF